MDGYTASEIAPDMLIKDWQRSMYSSDRDVAFQLLLEKILQSRDVDSETFVNEVEDAFGYARDVEKNLFLLADSQEEYMALVRNQLSLISEEFDTVQKAKIQDDTASRLTLTICVQSI